MRTPLKDCVLSRAEAAACLCLQSLEALSSIRTSSDRTAGRAPERRSDRTQSRVYPNRVGAQMRIADQKGDAQSEARPCIARHRNSRAVLPSARTRTQLSVPFQHQRLNLFRFTYHINYG